MAHNALFHHMVEHQPMSLGHRQLGGGGFSPSPRPTACGAAALPDVVNGCGPVETLQPSVHMPLSPSIRRWSSPSRGRPIITLSSMCWIPNFTACVPIRVPGELFIEDVG